MLLGHIYRSCIDSSGGRNGFLSSATTAGLWSFLQSVFSVFDLILDL